MKYFLKFLFVGAVCSGFLFSQNINTGLSFLKLGTNARSSGMGEAFTAIPNDHSSFSYNPAAIRSSDRSQLTLSHRDGFAETTTEYLGATIPGKDVTFAISGVSTSINGIEIRQQPGEAEGTFDAKNGMLGVGAAISLSDDLSIGVTGKLLYEKIFIDEASGYAVDAGLLYSVDKNITAGLSLTNLGRMAVLRTEHSTVPATIRGGASYRTSLSTDFALVAAGDIVKTIDDNGMHVHFGAEIMYDALLAFRAGYQSGYESKDFSTGVGVLYGILRFDYAFVPNIGAFTPNHSFSLSFYL